VATEVRRATSSGSAAAVATATAAGVGSSSQENCSSRAQGLPGAMGNQLSMAPVGQGGTQARQSLQMAGSTT